LPSQKKIIVVISDGLDRGSKATFENTLADLQSDNITVYAVQDSLTDPSVGDPHFTADGTGIYFEKAKTGASYTVNHSTQSYVIDPQGRLRLLVRHDRIAQDLAPDLRALLRE